VTLSAVPVPHPCTTLEQRWSACRAPVYQRRQRLVARVFRWCAMGSRTGHRRPCTSPRRHQCRRGSGYSTWVCYSPSWFDDAPYVCPGCHAVGGERCLPGCIDAELEEERREAIESGNYDDLNNSDDWECDP
jgi:hypothetical protein